MFRLLARSQLLNGEALANVLFAQVVLCVPKDLAASYADLPQALMHPFLPDLIANSFP